MLHERMSEEEFYRYLEEQTKEMFPEYQVELRGVEKSLSVKQSLLVRDPSSEVAPSLKLNEYYRDYLHAPDYAAASDQILKSIRETVGQAYIDAEQKGIVRKALDAMADWRNKVQSSLIMLKGNEEFLSGRPHKTFLNMAKVYYLVVDDLVEGHTSRIMITNEHMESMGCTLDELDAHAMVNTLQQNSFEIDSIENVLRGLLVDMPADVREVDYGEVTLPMFVVSNRTKCDGAAVIQYKDVLDRICDFVRDDTYYILPSSRHEVLAIPESFGKDVAALQRMVHEVNATQVPPEDLLSESVYVYHRGQELQICDPGMIEEMAETEDPEETEELEEGMAPVL